MEKETTENKSRIRSNMYVTYMFVHSIYVESLEQSALTKLIDQNRKVDMGHSTIVDHLSC